jgi:hypothetical protein
MSWKLIIHCLLTLTLCTVGCSRGPGRVKPPDIDPDSAAATAIEMYDADKNGSLSKSELAKIPGISEAIAAYDTDQNGSISQEEIAARITDLRKHGVGLTRLTCDVTLNGRGLNNATIDFEPESYLGDEVEPATGITNDRGIAQMAIPPDRLPESQRDLKAIHYGTYKVRITHPSIKLPPKYNTETTLGYESRPGDPYATFTLKTP